MTTRLSSTIAALLAVIVVSLAAFLAHEVAATEARSVFYDRLQDATRFADRASATSPVDEGSLQASLSRYDVVYGITVVVLNRDQSMRLSSRPRPVIPRGAAPAVAALLAGRQSRAPRTLLPWDPTPITLGQIVIRNGDIIGAVVVITPTDAARGRVWRDWLLLAGLCLLSIWAIVALARLVAGWVLGPVHALGDTMVRIRSGELQARALATSWPPELTRLADSFNAMADHVQAVIEAQLDFVGNASHQLRNPLGALLIRLEALTEVEPGPSAQAARTALDEGRHLGQILDGMLALARADRDRRPPRSLDIGDVVGARLAAWELIAAKREITLRRTDVEHGEHLVGLQDTASLSGAIDAVLDNALKFSAEESVVTVDLRRDGRFIDITVTDQGPGVEQEELGKVTDRFWRGNARQNVPGSGLGLSIAATLLERHGGALEVEKGSPIGLEVHLKVRAVTQRHTAAGQGLVCP